MKNLFFVLAVVAVLFVASSAEAGGRRLSNRERAAFRAGQQSVLGNGHCGVGANFGGYSQGFGGRGIRAPFFRFDF